MGKMISYNRPDGQSVAGYLAEPATAVGAPGMVVIQEWWGLNDQIKGVSDKLAAPGYRALVPELYRGKVALEANEAEHLMTNLNFGDAASQDVRGAAQYLKASTRGSRSRRSTSWRRSSAPPTSILSSTGRTQSTPSPTRRRTRRTCRS